MDQSLNLTLEDHEGELVARVQGEVEAICIRTNQDQDRVYGGIVWLGELALVGLKWDDGFKAWRFCHPRGR